MFTEKIMQPQTSEGKAARTKRYKRAEVAGNAGFADLWMQPEHRELKLEF